MDFTFTPEQEALREQARGRSSTAQPRAARWAELAELGWTRRLGPGGGRRRRARLRRGGRPLRGARAGAVPRAVLLDDRARAARPAGRPAGRGRGRRRELDARARAARHRPRHRRPRGDHRRRRRLRARGRGARGPHDDGRDAPTRRRPRRRPPAGGSPTRRSWPRSRPARTPRSRSRRAGSRSERSSSRVEYATDAGAVRQARSASTRPSRTRSPTPTSQTELARSLALLGGVVRGRGRRAGAARGRGGEGVRRGGGGARLRALDPGARRDRLHLGARAAPATTSARSGSRASRRPAPRSGPRSPPRSSNGRDESEPGVAVRPGAGRPKEADVVQGLMMDYQLNVPAHPAARGRAVRRQRDREPPARQELAHATRTPTSSRARSSSSWHSRKLGLEDGDRVGTFMWNHYQHLEAYIGAPVGGFVTHTLNLRLHPDDIDVHRDARRRPRAPRRQDAAGRSPSSSSRAAASSTSSRSARARRPTARSTTRSCSRTRASRDFAYRDLDENTAAAMCYTSGTTGLPKGVLYSHRAIALHALDRRSRSLGIYADDVVPARRADVPRERVGLPVLRDADRRRSRSSRARTSIPRRCSTASSSRRSP